MTRRFGQAPEKVRARMSTRSNIGVLVQDGSVTFIYCHFDGYPSHHVPLLTEHYATEDLARALVAPGDMSSLGATVGEKHDFNTRPDGVCTYYGRDRGEKGTEARTALTLGAFDEAAHHSYAYLFRDGRWMARGRRGTWATAEALLAAETEEVAS